MRSAGRGDLQKTDLSVCNEDGEQVERDSSSEAGDQQGSHIHRNRDDEMVASSPHRIGKNSNNNNVATISSRLLLCMRGPSFGARVRVDAGCRLN